MGTFWRVSVIGVDEAKAQALRAKVQAQLDADDRLLSTWKNDSALMRFNHAATTEPWPVSEAMADIVTLSLRIGAKTHGAMDITVGPLVNLWGFGPEPRRDAAPSDTEIAQARERVGYWLLQAREQPPALKKERADLYVDLSAIAKGYGVDRLAALVEAAGIGNYLITIGGEIRAKGHNGQNQPWTIAIEKPVAGQRAVERLIRIGDHSVSTSGDYRNFFEQNGHHYSHILNPRTGRPTPRALASVTVISNQSMVADATATALMASGPDAGFRLASEHHLAAFFIVMGPDGSFRERQTPEFEPYLVPEKP